MRDTVLVSPNHLGPLLRALRVERGISQQALAQQLGVTPSNLSQLEKDAAAASLQRLMRVLAQLDLELVIRDRTAPAPESQEWSSPARRG